MTRCSAAGMLLWVLAAQMSMIPLSIPLISCIVPLLTGYAIPAVNCVSSSGINACLEAARKNDAPIIIQFSSGGSQVSLSRDSGIGDGLLGESSVNLFVSIVLRWKRT